MEKQKLGKHHFWILLALAVLLIPVVIGGAAFGVGGAAREERKKIEAEVEKLNKATPKGVDYIKKLGEQKDQALRTLDHMGAAFLSMAAEKVKDFLDGALPGFKQHLQAQEGRQGQQGGQG